LLGVQRYAAGLLSDPLGQIVDASGDSQLEFLGIEDLANVFGLLGLAERRQAH
jgi:hypothetical protein